MNIAAPIVAAVVGGALLGTLCAVVQVRVGLAAALACFVLGVAAQTALIVAMVL